MAKVSAARNTIAAIVVLGTVPAIFLFSASSSPRAARRGHSDGLFSLRDNDSRDLSAALDSMAAGDLTVEITPARSRSRISRDELGQIAVAANEILAARRPRSTATTACGPTSKR